jgi:ribosomal protein S6
MSLHTHWQFFKLAYRINRATKGKYESLYRAIQQTLRP